MIHFYFLFVYRKFLFSLNLIVFCTSIYMKDRKNIKKMNKEVRMLLPKKDLIQVE